jgi:hypothetical protein
VLMREQAAGRQRLIELSEGAAVTTKQKRSEIVTDAASLTPVSAVDDRGCAAGRLCSARSTACLSAADMPRSGCVR